MAHVPKRQIELSHISVTLLQCTPRAIVSSSYGLCQKLAQSPDWLVGLAQASVCVAAPVLVMITANDISATEKLQPAAAAAAAQWQQASCWLGAADLVQGSACWVHQPRAGTPGSDNFWTWRKRHDSNL